MFNCLKIFLALFVAVAGVSAQTIWNGTADTSWYNSSQNEFTITTAEQLAGFAQLVNGEYYNMHGITITLGNNIMLNDTTDWQNWATTAPANSWTPIGNYNNPFYGKFDGAGYVIGGVYINNSNNYQGLFGYVSDGTIRNLGVVASYVKGNSSVGGLAGYNEENSSVSNCYATGNVTGNNSVGGLTGNNNNNNTGNNNNYGTINCYATGNVTGNSSVGGLVGRSTNASSVSNCYATGNVTGNSSVGGLAGSVGYNNITNCYYDSQTSGQNDQGKGIGLTTTEMKSQTFVNKLNSWIITDNNLSGWVYRAGNYPTFSNARPSGNIADYFADGDGTQSRPYIIQTPEQLELFSVFVDGGKTFEGEYIKLGANIMLNDTTDWQSWETIAPANSWTPIGNYYNPFYGTFDGAGYVIGGVYINNSNDYQGLFGANKGTIRNLGVVASYVKTIQSNSYAGGLAGHNDGSIKNCYATGNVSGNRYVGGLVGDNFYGTITNCYATGNVSGNTVGGLTGGNYGTIKNCYATGNVSGDIVGGLTGYKWGSIINCYYDKETSGQSDEGKGVGLTTTEMKSQTFADNLNDWAIFNNLSGANKWVYTPNNYPTLSNRATIADYFANGDGTQSYIIQTPKQLENLSFLVNSGYNFQGEYIKLGDNIMLNDTTEWQNWATTAPANSWTPIGNYNNNNFFSGTFDGAGYVIGGVYINSSNDYQGLFGYVRNGTIRNLGVVASYVKGNNYVGGLTGDNIFGNITNCYATGNVSGNNAVGGLAGWSSNGSSVSNCYATGNVTGTGNYVYVGGLTGYNLGIIINCYYDKETSGQNDQGKGVGLTTTEMKSQTLINKLNFGVIADNNLNGWVYTAGNYPTFSNARPSGNIADYFAGGDGTQSRPYIIQTPEQLEHFSVFVNTGKTFKGEYVKLGANIVLNDTTDWQNWETTAPANFWTPIGNNNNHFRGTFDGAGYVVSGVYINSSNDYQGLFGYVRNGTIRNLGVVASYVKGHECVGGLVGYNEGGTIKNCYATGNVSGTSNNYDDTGGLVGTNNKNGTITNCYATGSVSGFEYVGGLTGYNEGTIIRCYYDKETSGQNDEGKGVGLTTTEMKSQTFVNKLNFGVIADNNLSGWGYTAGNYPTFSNARPSEIVADYFAGGDGTQNNPYIIRTPEQLENFSSLTNIITTFKKQYIKLGANIMLNDTTNWQNWAATAPARTWTAIGTQFSNSRFQGTFDGAGYTVSGVYINNTSNYQGLFGYVRDATIKNLGVVASFVKGNNSVGGLVGYNYMSSNITNCYYTGNVSGNSVVGGLVGNTRGNNISNSYATGNVIGTNSVGGLVGYNNSDVLIVNSYATGNVTGTKTDSSNVGGLVGLNYNSSIRNSYATGNVTGTLWVGGLVGSYTGNDGLIRNSYATGNVTGTGPSHLAHLVGGLVGGSNSPYTAVFNCYYDSQTSGQSDSYGTGLTTAEMKSRAFAGMLNAAVIYNSLYMANIWIYRSGDYPTLGNEQPSGTVADYFASGDGTQNNPYIIQTPEQLEYFSFFVNAQKTFEGEYVKLGANISLNDTTNWQNWGAAAPANSWTPIGLGYNFYGGPGYNGRFVGTFDGAGYVIGGVYINNTSDYQGLFGYIGGTIRNLGIVASFVKGNNYVGGLAGSGGNITNCYVSGNVSGTGDYIGGLAGSGGNYIGVLADNGGNIANCYASGNVSGTGDYIGGLIGSTIGVITNCYYDSQTSGRNDTGKGTGLTTAEIKSQMLVDKLNLGAIANNNLSGWVHTSGNYPVFGNARPSGTVADYFASGDGTQNNPYIIRTSEQLEYFSVFTNAGKSFGGEYIKLGADISLNDATNWNNWATTAPANFWTPIGTINNPFIGTFDGVGYVISGVYINNTSNYQGLFGYIGGIIKNLGVIASYVKGNDNVGGLAGYKYGSGGITNCYSAGNVTGTGYVGGLVGYNGNGSITNCYATGNVAGTGNRVGGLAGYNGSVITNCYATGNVTGTGYVGGLVGSNTAPGGNIISNSYATGNVTGTGTNVGGLAGGSSSSISTSNNYYDAQTVGQSDEGKGTPKTTAQMKQQATYNNWNFNTVWKIDEYINDGYPYLRVAVSNISDFSITSAVYNETKSLSGTVEPINAENRDIVWVVNDGYSDRATISGNDITFTKLGQVTIRATITNGSNQGDYFQNFNINVAKAPAAGVAQTQTVVSGYAHSYYFDLSTLLPSVPGMTGVTYSPVVTNNADGVLDALIFAGGNTLYIPVNNVSGAGLLAEITVAVSSNNYENFSAVITVSTVNKTLLDITGITMPDGVYNGNRHGYTGTPVLIRDDNGETVTGVTFSVLYESTDGKGYASAFAPTDAGEYRLTLKVPDSDMNYIGEAEFEFTIAKANPPYYIPSYLTATVGQTLSDIWLPSEWEWVTPTDLVGEAGRRTHKVRFIAPIDNNNYNTEDIDIEIVVYGGTSISKPEKSGDGLGVIFEKNVVSDELKIVKTVLPDGKDGKITSVVIYDNTGNAVYSGEGAKQWNLRNKSGRIVANGSYLVIVEAKDAGGKTYWYSAKVAVKR